MFDMTHSKSGDILSALIAFAVALSTLTSPDTSQVMIILNRAGAMPEWAIIAAICSILCLVTTLTDNAKAYSTAKFVSGCVWGSVVLVLGLEGQLFPLFWIATVLFAFDFFTVIRSYLWSQKDRF